MKQLVIIAAGGLAREAAAVIERTDEWELIGFIDDEPSLTDKYVAGKRVLGGLDAVVDYPEASFLVTAGKGVHRRAIIGRLTGIGIGNDRFATLIAPDVHVPASCSIGVGSILLANVVLTADVTIGTHVVAMPGAVLTHDDFICDYATICAQVALGGGVTVSECAYLGMAASVKEGVTIGADCVLGMGAALLQDSGAGETWVGVPARPRGSR